LADDVSSIAGFQGHLTEVETVTFYAGSVVNKQSFGTFFYQREKGYCGSGE